MKLSEIMKNIMNGKKSTAVIVVVGVIGLVLIMLSSFMPTSVESEEEEIIETETLTSQSEYYTEMEKRLEDFLKNVEGVGNVKVMITLEGSEEYIYATEGKKSISENETQEEKNYVMSSGTKSPILETVLTPKIQGVVIACQGAGNPTVQETVYNMVSKVFGISTSDIYVTQLI